jgi:hypothetical protein
MCANNPPVSGASNGDTKAVEVILDRQQNALLANLFLSNVTITSRAVAKVNLPGYTCDLSLATTGTGISVQGSATLNLTDCGMAANSSDAQAISFGGANNDILTASWFQTVGNYNASGNPVLDVPTRLTNSTPVKDPYSCDPPTLGCAGRVLYPSQSATTPEVVTTTPAQSNPPCFAATGNTLCSPACMARAAEVASAQIIPEAPMPRWNSPAPPVRRLCALGSTTSRAKTATDARSTSMPAPP